MASAAGVSCIINRIVYVTVGAPTPFAFVIARIYSKNGIVLHKFNGVPVGCGMTFSTAIFCKKTSVGWRNKYGLTSFP